MIPKIVFWFVYRNNIVKLLTIVISMSRDSSTSRKDRKKRDPITTIRALNKIKEGEQGM